MAGMVPVGPVGPQLQIGRQTAVFLHLVHEPAKVLRGPEVGLAAHLAEAAHVPGRAFHQIHQLGAGHGARAVALAKEAAAAAVHARRAVHHAPGLGQHVAVDVPVLAAGLAAQPGLGRDDVGGLVDVHLAHVDT